jgi:hypothetical protein
MPLVVLALLSYASLVAITWPLVATKLKRNLPVEPFEHEFGRHAPSLGRVHRCCGVSNPSAYPSGEPRAWEGPSARSGKADPTTQRAGGP